MARHGGGAIVNVSSGGATRAHRGMAAYDASKGGIEAFTRTTAVELAPYGIRVNTLVPGPDRHQPRRAGVVAGAARRDRPAGTGRPGRRPHRTGAVPGLRRRGLRDRREGPGRRRRPRPAAQPPGRHARSRRTTRRSTASEPSVTARLELRPYGDSGLLAGVLGDDYESRWRTTQALAAAVRDARPPWLVDLVATYDHLFVTFDPGRCDHAGVEALLWRAGRRPGRGGRRRLGGRPHLRGARSCSVARPGPTWRRWPRSSTCRRTPSSSG